MSGSVAANGRGWGELSNVGFQNSSESSLGLGSCEESSVRWRLED